MATVAFIPWIPWAVHVPTPTGGPVKPGAVCGQLLQNATNEALDLAAWAGYFFDPTGRLIQWGQASPAGAGPAAPAVTPEVLAVQYWHTVTLPEPHPNVPPGWAITGKPAYLVTGGTTDPPVYRATTPLGLLTIQATGEYWVDWGGPGPAVWAGPYREEGEAWPDGMISHVYDNTATVNIVVRETWAANWTLGAARGHVANLQTRTTIPDFVIDQVQAVLNN